MIIKDDLAYSKQGKQLKLDIGEIWRGNYMHVRHRCIEINYSI